MEEITSMKQCLEQDRPEQWDALPDIELYMDQVVSYLPRQSAGGKIPPITSAMINNYVKDGLMPRANGKRYSKEHLVYLTAIGMLKNVLTVKDMKLLLHQVVETGQEEPFYNRLLNGIDSAFNTVNADISSELTESEMTVQAMHLALYSFAAKTACEHILAILRELHPEEDPKLKKELEKEAARKAKQEKTSK